MLLLVITLFPFYYMVLLSVRPLDAVLQDPGQLWPGRRDRLGHLPGRARPRRDGGQGFLELHAQQRHRRGRHVVLTLLVSIPGAYAVSRLRVLRAPPDQRRCSSAVYLFPAILLAIPLFVFFTRIGLRGSLGGLVDRLHRPECRCRSTCCATTSTPSRPASRRPPRSTGARRLQAMRHISLPLALPAIMATALFVFMIAWNEFLFALLFLVEDRELDGVARPVAAVRQHRGPNDRADGRIGRPDRPDHRAVLRHRALLTGGLTAGAEKG